jgi:hypothetical protein
MELGSAKPALFLAFRMARAVAGRLLTQTSVFEATLTLAG